MALVSLLLSSVCSNTQPVFSKTLYMYGWTPVSVYFLALLVTNVFLGIHEFLEFAEAGRWRMSRSDVKGILLTTIVGGVLSPVLYFLGIAEVRASEVALLIGLSPFFTVLFAVIFLRERFTLEMLIGGVFLFVGVVAQIWPDLLHARVGTGALLLFGASVTGALSTILHKKFVKNRHLDSVVFVRTALSLVLIGAWLSYTEPASFQRFFEPQDLWLVFGLPVIGVLLPFFLFFGALRKLTALEAGLISSVGPVSGILLAAAFLGEEIQPHQMLSLLLIIIGIVNINVPLTRWRIVPSRLIEIGPLHK